MNRIDICEAYYTFATMFHAGQGSEVYGYFARLDRVGFRPGLSSGRPERLECEALETFAKLIDKHGVKYGYKLTHVEAGLFTLTDASTGREVAYQQDYDLDGLARNLGYSDDDDDMGRSIAWLYDHAGETFYHDLSDYFCADDDGCYGLAIAAE